MGHTKKYLKKQHFHIYWEKNKILSVFPDCSFDYYKNVNVKKVIFCSFNLFNFNDVLIQRVACTCVWKNSKVIELDNNYNLIKRKNVKSVCIFLIWQDAETDLLLNCPNAVFDF
jgi:hypothetical protein